jgi:hypothetical protein
MARPLENTGTIGNEELKNDEDYHKLQVDY